MKKIHQYFILIILFLNTSINIAHSLEKSRKENLSEYINDIDNTPSHDSIRKSKRILERLIQLQKINPQKLDAITQIDSDTRSVKSIVKSIVNVESAKSKDNFQTHKELLEQSKSFVSIYAECEKANNFLKQGFNYSFIQFQKSKLTEWKELAIQGIIENPHLVKSVRNLTASSILLDEIQQKTMLTLKKVKNYHSDLERIQFRLDSLVNSSNIYIPPTDTVNLKSYLQKMVLLESTLNPVDKSLNAALDSVQHVEIQFEILKLGLESDISTLKSIRKNLLEEMDPVLVSGTAKEPLSLNMFISTLNYSIVKALLVLVFYVINHAIAFGLILVAFVLVYVYIKMLSKRCLAVNLLKKINQHTVILKYPVSSSVILSVSMLQFLLPNPPIVISAFLWILTAVTLSYLLLKTINIYWFYIWHILILIFVLVVFDNLILAYSELERYLLYFISFSTLAISLNILLKSRTVKVVSKPLIIPYIIMIVFEIAAIFYNHYGHYNVSKSLMSNGIFILTLSFILIWCVRLGNELLQITMLYQKSINEEVHTPLDEIFKAVYPIRVYITILLAAGFLILRISYSYQAVIDPILEFFSASRSIGKFSFTFESIVIFFLVMYVSSIVSRIATFLTSGSPLPSKTNKHSKLASWIIIVRIGIISVGTVLAFIAAGIPMDRLAIVISALGVGMGFGLQNFTNNLVSGIIIAFEKPINVGDFVEIAGRSGKMKSIGIRSSIVTTWDGADVIIPNGDLMNQHLTNWTMGNTRKRFEVVVGVAYGTNLELAKKLLLDLMNQDSRIMKKPSPAAIITTFNASSIDYLVRFWVYHYDQGLDVKSDLILQIDKAFKNNNIEIPYSKQDIYIRSVDKIYPHDHHVDNANNDKD